jgi:hypothetical protein
MKTKKEYCSRCGKEYEAKVWTKIGQIELTQSHGCKEEKEFYKLKKQYA